jgi:hypothetical protein
VRPEDIAISAQPLRRDNCFAGQVADMVQVAGTVRYRVAVGSGCTLIVRASAERRSTVLGVNESVHVGWDATDMQVLPE